MTRKQYDEELARVRELIMKMCVAAKESIVAAAKAFAAADEEAAAIASAREAEADELENAAERLCMAIVVRRQPVAHDLAVVTAAARMIGELERIADQASEIAGTALRLGGAQAPECMDAMFAAAIKMAEKCMAAAESHEPSAARDVIRYDDVMDGLFAEARTRIAETVRGGKRDGESALDLMMTAKYLERIGDHYVNTAEWMLFALGQPIHR